MRIDNAAGQALRGAIPISAASAKRAHPVGERPNRKAPVGSRSKPGCEGFLNHDLPVTGHRVSRFIFTGFPAQGWPLPANFVEGLILIGVERTPRRTSSNCSATIWMR